MKCDNCENTAAFTLDVPWGSIQHFCEGCLPGSVKSQFGPEYLKPATIELPVEEVVETVAEEESTPAKKKKSAVAEEPAVEVADSGAANVSDN